MAKREAKAEKMSEEAKPNEILKTVDEWAQEERTPTWVVAAFKEYAKLTDSKKMTKAEFTKGAKTAVHRR